MIDDAERREAACWIRDHHDSFYLDTAFAVRMFNDSGTDLPFEDFDAVAYLADLIDRPTCHDSSPMTREYFSCDRCEAEIDTQDDYGNTWTFEYCPECGAEVVE